MSLGIKQKQALNKMEKLKCGAIFMKMGTGKTKVAIDLAESRIKDFEILVWICPSSLIEQTKEEIKKWQKTKMQIQFFSVESIGMSDKKYLDLINLAENHDCFCVLDESINIKNATAKRTRRLIEIAPKFKYRFILNGTPLTKSLIDLWGQIEFLSPKILNMTEAQFASNFLIYKEYGYRPWTRWSKPANEKALVEILRPYIYDCDLDIEVNLNTKRFTFYLDEYEAENYYFVKDEYFKRYEFKNIDFDSINFLEMTQLFQHTYTICEEKLNKLDKILKEIEQKNEKVVIFCKFLDEVEYLKNKYNCKVFTGKEKDDIKDFNILVCTYGVGSFGLNLQIANNLIYFSQTFDYKHKEQSKFRIYRTGQAKDCNIYDFYVDTGLEKIIRKSLSKKENVLNNVKNCIEEGKYEKL